MSTPLRLTIPEPCHENWQKMTPNEQGRHCLSCQKTVVDFTLMSDQEVLQYISTASSSVCGRFNNDQLNKTYQERKIKPSFTVRYAWHILVSAFLWVGQSASAQTNSEMQGEVDLVKVEKPKPKPKKKKLRMPRFDIFSEGIIEVKNSQVTWVTMGNIDYSSVLISRGTLVPILKTFGVVLDEKTKQPVKDVAVRLMGMKESLPVDRKGNFDLAISTGDGQLSLEVSAKGYETRKLTIPAYSLERVEILLQPNTAEFKLPDYAYNNFVVTDIVLEEEIPEPVIDEACVCVDEIVTSTTLGTPVIEELEETIFRISNVPSVICGPLSLEIKDERTRFPVGFASVRIKGEEEAVAADEAGKLAWKGNKANEEIILEVSSVGYQTKEVVIEKGGSRQLEVLLTPEADELKAVEVRGYPRRVCTDMVGSVVMVTKVPLKEQVLRSVKDTLQSWLPMKREITAYPNPAVKGNQVNLRLDLPKTGTYRLELLDASGRIVHAQQIQVAQPSQVASVPTQSVWSAGIYWFRLTNASDKKIYQTKVMLQ